MKGDINPELLGVAITTVITLGALLFRMGVRRERVDNIKHGLTLEVRSLRENNSQRFDRVELRLSSMDRQLTAIQDRHAENERWQGGVDRRLEAQDSRIARLESAA